MLNRDDPQRRSALEAFLGRAAEARSDSLTGWSRLTGGAIQQNLQIEFNVTGGPFA